MNGMSQYILTLTAAAILLAILRSLAGEGTTGAVIKLLGGVFMALTVISPVLELELPDVEQWISVYAADGRAAAAEGEALADQTWQTIIKERTAAYILDKAALYHTVPSVEIELDDGGAPVCVTLTGPVSPYAREKLAGIIETELGIGREAQQWIS